MASAIDAYVEFMALRHHFNSSYDYIKYNGQIKFSWREKNNFDKRKDYYQWEKLSKKPDLQNFIIANLLVDPKVWIYELNSCSECETVYVHWKRKKESFSYIFKEEIFRLPSNMYEEIHKIGDVSSLSSLYLKGKVSFETFYVLYMLLNIYGIVFIICDPILNNTEFKLTKYKPFMEKNFLIDEPKILNIAFEKFGYPIKEE